MAPKAPPRPPTKLDPPNTKAVTAINVYVVPCVGSPEPINPVNAIAANAAKTPPIT